MGQKHMELVKEAIERLRKDGITNVTTEAKVSPEGYRIDVLAFTETERIGIECAVQVQPAWIERKIEKYGPHLDRLIFLVPMGEEEKVRDILGVDEVWVSEMVLPTQSLQVGLPNKTMQKLDEIVNEGDYSTKQEIVQEAIRGWLKKRSRL